MLHQWTTLEHPALLLAERSAIDSYEQDGNSSISTHFNGVKCVNVQPCWDVCSSLQLEQDKHLLLLLLDFILKVVASGSICTICRHSVQKCNISYKTSQWIETAAENLMWWKIFKTSTKKFFFSSNKIAWVNFMPLGTKAALFWSDLFFLSCFVQWIYRKTWFNIPRQHEIKFKVGWYKGP